MWTLNTKLTRNGPDAVLISFDVELCSISPKNVRQGRTAWRSLGLCCISISYAFIMIRYPMRVSARKIFSSIAL